MQAAGDPRQDGPGLPPCESHADEAEIDYQDEEELETENHKFDSVIHRILLYSKGGIRSFPTRLTGRIRTVAPCKPSPTG